MHFPQKVAFWPNCEGPGVTVTSVTSGLPPHLEAIAGVHQGDGLGQAGGEQHTAQQGRPHNVSKTDPNSVRYAFPHPACGLLAFGQDRTGLWPNNISDIGLAFKTAINTLEYASPHPVSGLLAFGKDRTGLRPNNIVQALTSMANIYLSSDKGSSSSNLWPCGLWQGQDSLLDGKANGLNAHIKVKLPSCIFDVNAQAYTLTPFSWPSGPWPYGLGPSGLWPTGPWPTGPGKGGHNHLSGLPFPWEASGETIDDTGEKPCECQVRDTDPDQCQLGQRWPLHTRFHSCYSAISQARQTCYTLFERSHLTKLRCKISDHRGRCSLRKSKLKNCFWANPKNISNLQNNHISLYYSPWLSLIE